MKTSITTSYFKVFFSLATLLLLAGGCAAPPPSSNLQKRIDELLQIQQQQARQLTELTQQFAELQVRPTPPATTTDIPEPGVEVPAGRETIVQALPAATAAADIAEMTEAAALYLEAFAAIATNRMADAEKGFKAFVERYPDHKYTGNARYWLAESLLAQQKSQLAETILLDIIDNPDQQGKAAAAMARLVHYYRDSGDQDKAEDMLQVLSSRFPESSELTRLLRSTEPR